MSSLYDIAAGSYTAQLVVSDAEAYVALSVERQPLGPNGEPRIAQILHTSNGGRSWRHLHWRCSVLSRLRYPGFPNWPPEAVMSMALESGSLKIQHRDEHVIFEPGGESLWEARLNRNCWSLRRVRRMDYEGGDHAAGIPRIEVALPSAIIPPPNP